MEYNIDFEVVTLIFATVIYVFHKLKYTVDNPLNRIFQMMEIVNIILIVTDISSAVCISYYQNVHPILNAFVNGLNFSSVVVIGFIFSVYIRTTAEQNKRTYISKPNLIICILFLISSIVNMFTGFYFSFTKEGYIHGPLYLLQTVVAYYYVVYSGIILIVFRKKMKRNEIMAGTFYVLFVMIMAVFQMFCFPKFLMFGMVIEIIIVVMLFSLETPDYVMLKNTMVKLEIAKQEAEKANNAKSVFLANMSHEIRTPINAVIGMNEMILRESKEPDIKHYAVNVENASKTLLSLVNGILDFSKIEMGNMELHPGRYETGSLIDDTVNMIKVKAEQKKLELKIEVADDVPAALIGDELRIKQCIVNIANNAVKYTKEGYVKLDISKRDVGDNKIELIIACSDTGIGIKEEELSNLFKDFVRLDLDKNKTIEGTGLGLAITKYLVRMMDGDVFVESKYGEGSVFTIKLMQEVADSSPIGKLRSTESVMPEKREYEELFVAADKKVLVVDDIEMNVTVVKCLLEQTKLNIDEAYGGQECLDKLKSNHYDIVLLDHMMPEIDGMQVLYTVNQEKYSTVEGTVFIALTANAIVGAREFYLERGFADYLSKPIDPIELEKMIAKYI